MAVLKRQTNYKSGDTVTAEIVNDTIETAIAANELATEANQFATNADKLSARAAEDSNAAKVSAEQAKIAACEALEKANDVATKAERGEFDGANGVIVPTSGIFGLQVVDGNLVAFYEGGEEAPKIRIDEDGNLIYEY